MARISGVNLPKGKRIQIALTYVFGIGKTLSTKILNDLKIDLDTKVEDLSDAQEQAIRDVVIQMSTEGDLKRQITNDIKRLQEIGSYRGFRHRRGLPARGQRTKTNSRTKRGKRGVGSSGKIKITKK